MCRRSCVFFFSRQLECRGVGIARTTKKDWECELGIENSNYFVVVVVVVLLVLFFFKKKTPRVSMQRQQPQQPQPTKIACLVKEILVLKLLSTYSPSPIFSSFFPNKALPHLPSLSLTHSVTDSLTYSLTHSLTHSLTPESP